MISSHTLLSNIATYAPRDPHAPLTSSAKRGRTRVGMDDDRRRTILADPKIHAAIRAVAKLRGVPRSDLDDVVNEVLEDELQDENLPLGDIEQARMYLTAVARHKAIDRARARKRDEARRVSPGVNTADPRSLPPEERAMAHKMFELGKKLFPRTHGWFERSALGGESHVSIAAEAGVSPGHVRHEVSHIRRTLRTLGVVGIATILVMVVGMRLWRMPGGGHLGGDDNVAATRYAFARTLRDAAKQQCDQQQWEACVDSLARAASLDPDGDTPELRELRKSAEKKSHDVDATPGH